MYSRAEANVPAAISWSSIGPERSFIVVVTRACRYGDSATLMLFRWAIGQLPIGVGLYVAHTALVVHNGAWAVDKFYDDYTKLQDRSNKIDRTQLACRLED